VNVTLGISKEIVPNEAVYASMFVIGDQVLTGLQDRETLEAVIREELNGQGNAAPAG
jgi:hypothetical protein